MPLPPLSPVVLTSGLGVAVLLGVTVGSMTVAMSASPGAPAAPQAVLPTPVAEEQASPSEPVGGAPAALRSSAVTTTVTVLPPPPRQTAPTAPAAPSPAPAEPVAPAEPEPVPAAVAPSPVATAPEPSPDPTATAGPAVEPSPTASERSRPTKADRTG